MIFSVAPEKEHKAVLESFRGQKAHDFEWLKRVYVEKGKTSIPSVIGRHLTRVNTWATDMRYLPGMIKKREVAAFLEAAVEVIRWADERL